MHFGQMADMTAIMEIANEHGLKVIEDAAQAIGSEPEGHRAGSIGDLGCFSFYPPKNLGGVGDGGMVVTNDAALADSVLPARPRCQAQVLSPGRRWQLPPGCHPGRRTARQAAPP